MTSEARPNPVLYLPGTALCLLAALALTFVAQVVGLSQLRYEREQRLAYADFRTELARGEAPVGQQRVRFADDGTEQRALLRPGEAVAVLRIPSLGLRTVVFEGTSAAVLQNGPGHRRDTVLPGQSGTSVLMGRRAAYGGPFKDIDLMLPGELIVATTGQGEHTYRVLSVGRPGDPAPSPVGPGQGRLTLVTADGSPFQPTDVVRVFAELVTATQPTPGREFGASALPPAELPMATDPAAWTPLVLWGQALLLAALGITWLRLRWGAWQAWIVGLPSLTALGLAAADQAARLLPNLT